MLALRSPARLTGATKGKWLQTFKNKADFRASDYPHFDPLLRALKAAAEMVANLLGPSYAASSGGVLLLSSLAFRGQPKRDHAGEIVPGTWAPEPPASHRWEHPVPKAWPQRGVASASSFSRDWRLPSPVMLERVKGVAGIGGEAPAAAASASGAGGAAGGLQPTADTGVLFVGSCEADREAAAAALCAYCDADLLLGMLRYHPQWPLRGPPAAGGGAGGAGAGAAAATTEWLSRHWDDATETIVYTRRERYNLYH